MQAQAPNTRLQRTPLRVVRDRAFFSVSICYNVVAIYYSGAAKAQPVGQARIKLSSASTLFSLDSVYVCTYNQKYSLNHPKG